MSESARFELVEGTTFQLPDGSSVTVRDGQLELSDGRRLPMPAAGEAITVERTVTRPDGGTSRIKHTIRLSETEPVVETPARPFPGAGPGSDEENVTETKEMKEAGETVPAPVSAAAAVEAVPAAGEDAGAAAEPAETADKVDSSSAAPEQPPPAPISESQLPEVPSKEPTAAREAGEAPVTPTEPTLMGVNCGRRSIREMLWGSIPESGFGEDEDEPKAPPKGLLNKSYSIKEEDESEHEEDETHEEALESSENADESFEFADGKAKDAEKGKKTEAQKELEAVKEPNDSEEDKAKESAKDEEAEKKKVPEKEETKGEEEPEKEPKPEEVSTEQVQDDPTTKVKLVTFVTSVQTESSPEKADDADKEPEAKEEPAQKTTPEKPSTELLTEQTAAGTATTTIRDQPSAPSANQPAEPHHEKPHLTRQDQLPSSGNLVAQAGHVVRVGVPLLDTAPDSTPADAAPARSDEVTHDLHLKLTPILRSLESDEPKSAAAGGDGKRAPSEDRKGTVPPNTPAVAEDREGLLGADEPESEPEPVCVPRVVSYYESISPRASPAPTRPSEAEASAVPKVIKFAVPMEPEKVYLGSQEPEEMEDTPIPHAAEPPARVELAPEPAALRQQTQVLIPVRGSPEDLDPLSALAASETAAQQQPSAPEEKSDDPATPSTTPEKNTVADPAQDAAEDTAATEADPQKTAPHVYNPALFEPEPKRPFTAVMEEEDAPAYEPSVFDARTLPIDRKTSAVVTEQPPPFGDDERTDPRDPFLPSEPRPVANVKEFDWFTNCFDLCCCCWAP